MPLDALARRAAGALAASAAAALTACNADSPTEPRGAGACAWVGGCSESVGTAGDSLVRSSVNDAHVRLAAALAPSPERRRLAAQLARLDSALADGRPLVARLRLELAYRALDDLDAAEPGDLPDHDAIRLGLAPAAAALGPDGPQ